jgi:hypothetical protein
VDLQGFLTHQRFGDTKYLLPFAQQKKKL